MAPLKISRYGTMKETWSQIGRQGSTPADPTGHIMQISRRDNCKEESNTESQVQGEKCVTKMFHIF